MLSKKIISKLLEEDRYCVVEYLKNNKILIPEEDKKEFKKQFGIDNLSEEFMEYYLFSPDSPFTLPLLETIYNKETGLLMLQNDDCGVMVYDLKNDKLYDMENYYYDNVTDYLKEIDEGLIKEKWNSFGDYLEYSVED